MKIRRWSAAVALAAALAGCGVANPWPDAHSTGPVTVTLIGDSLLYQAGPYVAGALAWDGMSATVNNTAIGGTGELDDQHTARVDAVLDQAPAASVVVFEYSGNCFWSPGGGCAFTPGTPEFYDAWRTQMIADTEYAKAKGLRVIWVASPPFGPAAGGHADVVASLSTMTQEVATEEGVGFVDWRVALADTTGKFQSLLFYADPFAQATLHTVRDPDDIHFVVDGDKRAAAWVAAGVVQSL